MDDKLCGYHEDHKNRIKRCEDDIKEIFGRLNASGRSAWVFVGTAAIALLGALFNFITQLTGK